jgi:hypothetical protein
MLKRCKELQTSHMICFLAILYIALGLHLVHPVFHDHSDHDHTISNHSVDRLKPAAEENKNHFCPICDFLATHPFYQSVYRLSIETNGPLISTVPFLHHFTFKTCLKPGEPRAPPHPHSLPYAYL